MENIGATLLVDDAVMDPHEHELDILTRLDSELPIVDPEVLRLTEQVKPLVDTETLAQLEEGYRAGIARFGARCLAPGHGPITEADVDFH